MSSAKDHQQSGSDGSGASAHDSTQSKIDASQALSASLSAHLSKPSAPAGQALAQMSSSASSSSSVHSREGQAAATGVGRHARTGSDPNATRAPILANGGKAVAAASLAGSVPVDDEKLWRSAAARRAEKAWALQSEKALYQSDSRFKKYAAAIDKCLTSFESVSEWADFIAFLGRLLKVLQAYPQYNAIPRKLVVAKRLSQCLNPALPSGVHQRALDVYDQILTVISVEGLRRDLAVWSPGLLPFLPFASTNVKPIALGIIERHFLQLGFELRTIIKPLQLSILPSLEEEASEFFDRSLKALDKIIASVGLDCFLQVLWLQLVNIPAVRLAALHFLARRLPKLNNDASSGAAAELSRIVGPDPGLMVRAFAAALEDASSVLVQRAMLDILVTHLQIDSPAFTSAVREHDRVLLVRAALTVVLRRDLSLNRRLYAWLLGASEEQDNQLDFFEKHSLAYARAALMESLSAQNSSLEESSLMDRQRTIRILISLLDKWSIGLPLTNAMIVDVLETLRRDMARSSEQSSASRASAPDISTTAKMLFEAIDPFALFRQLFFAVRTSAGREPDDQPDVGILSLLRFVFFSFRVHDEESRVVHLPTLLAALVELSARQTSTTWKLEAMQLARDILALIPKRVFANRSTKSVDKTTSFEQHAVLLYSEKASSADAAAQQYVGFQHPHSIAALLDLCSAHFTATAERDVVVEVSSVLCALFAVLDSSNGPTKGEDNSSGSELIPWDAVACEGKALELAAAAQTFVEVEAYTELLLASKRCRALGKHLSLRTEATTRILSDKLFTYMSRSSSPYHVRAVDLFWAVADATGPHLLVPLLCRQVATGRHSSFDAGLDIFDVLWRHSEESRLRSAILREPLLRILDVLQSSSSDEQMMISAWVRNNHRPLTALLDPLLDWVDENKYVSSAERLVIDGTDIEHLVFRRMPDARRIRHSIKIVLQISRIAGANFSRAMRMSFVQSAIKNSSESSAPTSYGRVICDALGLLLRGDTPNPDEEITSLHAAAGELLHAVISKMQVDDRVLASIETALLERLLIDINAEIPQAQTKLLEALHGIMLIHSAPSKGKTAATPPALLLPILKAGLTQQANYKTLQSWTDFVMATSPIYKSCLSNLLMPLNQGLCALVRTSIEDLNDAYDARLPDTTSMTTEGEVLAYLSMSERVLLQSLDYQGDAKPSDAQASSLSEKVDPFGFMGALSNVFSTESANADGDQPSPNAVWRSLHHTVRTLHLVWLVATPTDAISRLAASNLPDSRVDTLSYVKSQIQSRCRRYLEKLYRNHSGEVVEALVACWQTSTAAGDAGAAACAFEILGQLAPSAQIVVTFLCDVISTRMAPVAAVEKTSRNSAIPVVSNGMLFAFLEAYLGRLDDNATMQVWPVVIMLIKDILSSSAQHKAQIYPALRCLTVTAQHLAEGQKADDRRIRKELMDSYIRLCDLAVLIAGRSFDATPWIGRRTANADSYESDEKAPINSDALSASVADMSPSSPQLIEAIQLYLAKNALPALRRFGAEADRIVGLCSNIVYYIVTSALRQRKQGVPEISEAILALTKELTRNPGTIKYWRAPVADLFLDAKFFEMDVKSGQAWLPVVHALMSSDKERFVEVVGRVSPPSTNIFTNREAETTIRAVHVRRLSYAVFAAPKDYWLPQLPLIQEKLVDLLRNSTTDPVVSEVYLCLRVLLARFSSQHFSSLWPVVITEMVRLYEDCLEELPADDSDRLMLVFAASKFLDLLLTLQVDEFQVHQWLFLTDTADIVYPPSDWVSDSLLDRLALAVDEKRGTHRNHRQTAEKSPSAKSTSRFGQGSKPNSPMLASSVKAPAGAAKRVPFLRGFLGMHIHAMEDLQPFFANASLYAYESTYNAGDAIDMGVVEETLLADMFPRSDAEQHRLSFENGRA